MAAKQQTVTVELTALGPLTTAPARPADGWGEGAQEVRVTGPVAEIVVRLDGESRFGVRILESGDLILTGYRDVYTTDVPRQLRLTNDQSWTGKRARA